MSADHMEPMYQRWKDASPKLTFPFSVSHKGHLVKHTWQDVREAFLLDGVSTTLHRTTGHMTPTSLQSAIIRDEIKRSMRSPRNNGAASARGTSSDLPPIPTPPATSRSRREPDPFLLQHGRVAYLERNRKTRFSSNVCDVGFTSVNRGSYGFAARNNITVPTSPQYHRRVTGLRDAFRPNGVFTSAER